VLKKSKHTNDVLFIDASAESVRPGNKNKLSEANRKRILDAFATRTNKAHFSRLVPASEIAENGYILSVPAYLEKEDTSEAIDISALNLRIGEIVGRQAELRSHIDTILADLEDAP
jgi:type I restriction enzyme M protein